MGIGRTYRDGVPYDRNGSPVYGRDKYGNPRRTRSTSDPDHPDNIRSRNTYDERREYYGGYTNRDYGNGGRWEGVEPKPAWKAAESELERRRASTAMGTGGRPVRNLANDTLMNDPRNPDPKRFVIKSFEEVGEFFIVEINYPNCTNFEGNKIAVYSKADVKSEAEFRRLGEIDPHFSGVKGVVSPVARFEPTVRGRELARRLCKPTRSEFLRSSI